jgi:choline dehydrogenase-like flavoprotein
VVTGAGAGAGGAAVARRLAELGARSVVCLEQGDWMRWSANPNVRRWTADHPAESVAEVEDVTGDNETLLVCAPAGAADRRTGRRADRHALRTVQ